MKKSELIARLNEIPGDPEVAIFDHLKNLHYDDGDGCSAGIYQQIEVGLITNDGLPPDHPAVVDQMKAWIAISFPNEDYAEVFDERKCRVCGCTDDDCRQCIEKTGGPCHWVEEDLCSACKRPSAGDSLLLPGRDF